ncbi:MMPL family transporter, partial [Candidatus Bipolaricaulota bacterium]|nr:MMPL family transporter [Candidatus Bipolaricaulota bacterium]
MERFVNFVYTKSKFIIALVVIINLASIVLLFRISIDTDITGFFTEGNVVYDEYVTLTEKYDISESLVLLIEDDESLLTEDNMTAIHTLVVSVEEIPGINEVQSFLPQQYPSGGILLDVDERFIERHYDILEEYIRQDYSPARELLSDDEGTGIISLTVSKDANGAEIVDSLEQLVAHNPDMHISLAGDSVIGATLEWYLIRIIFLLPPTAAALVLFVFYRMLRNVRLALLSMLPAAFATLWTLGTIFLQGGAVNIVTVISPIFILVMGSADGLHYTTHMLEKMALHSDPRTLTLETMRMVLKPIILTSVTTMAGFGSLAWSDLEPIRQMGLYIPLGIGYACLLSVLFLPALLSRIELPAGDPPDHGGVIGFFVTLPQRKRAILTGVALLLLVSGINLPNLEVITDPLLYFKEGSDIRQTFK